MIECEILAGTDNTIRRMSKCIKIPNTVYQEMNSDTTPLNEPSTEPSASGVDPVAVTAGVGAVAATAAATGAVGATAAFFGFGSPGIATGS